ncbi:MAG: polysaccharide deacetylase family protein [Nitrospirae bacterium]|nr:polysaccharide deacetylase family protein [Nitrospirota bacterium]
MTEVKNRGFKWILISMGIKRNLHEIYLEASHFLENVYPDFVTSRRPDRIEGIPVFTFHSIRPKTFEEQLEFLKKNNYITVSVDQFYNYLSGKVTLPERAILLTIDDGRKSVWKYGFPLLRKYGFCATVFIIPGHTKEVSSEFGFQSEENDREILSWQEILVMSGSGLIDFESHTLYHNRVFTEPEIVDFLGPSYSRSSFDCPAVPAGFEISVLEKEPSGFYGLPIYMSNSLMLGKQRFIDDPEFREVCKKYYREVSGLKRWKKKMFGFCEEYRWRNNLKEGFTTYDDIAEEIFDSLYTSKRTLEERLGKPVNHLCYPFGIWSQLSDEMAKKAGYLSAFCAYIPHRPINRTGDDPYKIVRLKDDYIFRLPGKGRRPLTEILTHKLKRRLNRERIY